MGRKNPQTQGTPRSSRTTFEALMDQARERAPGQRLVTIEEIGSLAVYLASDEAAASTGTLAYIDGGYSIMD